MDGNLLKLRVFPVPARGDQKVWITPSGTALAVGVTEGREQLGDAEIDGLFKKK
jgi:hypothetical protein